MEATAQVKAQASSATLEECVSGFAGGEAAKAGISAGQQALANRARALLTAKRIDMEDASAVAEALRPLFWVAEGMARPVNDAGKPITPEAGTPAFAAYQRVATNLGRMKHAIMGRAAPAKAKVRVAKTVQTSIDALLAEHGAAVLKEALKRAIAAAK